MPNIEHCLLSIYLSRFDDMLDKKSQFYLYLSAEIVETTFVRSWFSDIRKETTSFLVVSKRKDQKRRWFSGCICPETTRHDQKRTNYWLKVGVGGKGWMWVGKYCQPPLPPPSQILTQSLTPLSALHNL